jgi:alpha-1,2-mannosyltransferase
MGVRSHGAAMTGGPRRAPKAASALLALAGLAAALALALPVGLRQHVGNDFHVFWQAGHNFLTGAPLYHGGLPGARPLKYPPFAALVFTPLALVPLPIAGVLMSLLNLGLWVAAAYLTRDILARLAPGRAVGRWTLLLALVLSAQFFLDNFHHVQMNEVTFVLVLLGLRAHLDGKDVSSAGFLVAAAAIKLTPVFSVAWLVIRGRRPAALATVPLALACVLVPLTLRGPSRGAAELAEYYHGFLAKHQHGEIGSYTAGQNVAALVGRMTRPPAADGSSYGWLRIGDAAAQTAYQALWLGLMAVYLGTLVLLRVRRAPVSAPELALLFLAALLLSPITFTTHLVPLLFVLAAALTARPTGPSTVRRIVEVAIAIGAVICGLSGRDLVGERGYHAVGGYSVCAWTMLALFGLMAIATVRTASASPRVSS